MLFINGYFCKINVQFLSNWTINIFLEAFLGLIPIFFIIPLDRYKNLLETSKLKLHIGRAVAGTFAMANLYLGLKFLPIADAITISFAAPIFATIFSIIFLSEIVRFYRWFAIILGIIGVIVVLKPGTTMFSYYSFFPYFILFRICNYFNINKKTI